MEVAGHGVVSNAGSAVLRLLADRTELTGALSKALRRRGFTPVHDRGRVLLDTAVCIAGGGRVLSDLAALRDQAKLFESVASDPTLWRALEEIGDNTLAEAEPKTLRYRILYTAVPAGPRPTHAEDQNPGDLALGPRARSRVPRRVRPRPDLTTQHHSSPRPRGTPTGQWNRRHPRRDRRVLNHDSTRNQDQKQK